MTVISQHAHCPSPFPADGECFRTDDWEEWICATSRDLPHGEVLSKLRRVFPPEFVQDLGSRGAHAEHPFVGLCIGRFDRFALLELGLALHTVGDGNRDFHRRLRDPGGCANAVSELNAGLLLGLAGANVAHEVPAPGGKRPDWTGTWPDGACVHVESKRIAESKASRHMIRLTSERQFAAARAIKTKPRARLRVNVEFQHSQEDLERQAAMRRSRSDADVEEMGRQGASVARAVDAHLLGENSETRIRVTSESLPGEPGIQLHVPVLAVDLAHEGRRILPLLKDARAQLQRADGAKVVVVDGRRQFTSFNALYTATQRALQEPWARELAAVFLMATSMHYRQMVPYTVALGIAGERVDDLPEALFSGFTVCSASHWHFDPLLPCDHEPICAEPW